MDMGWLDAINAGGNLGILALGLALLRISNRVTRLEIIEQLRSDA